MSSCNSNNAFVRRVGFTPQQMGVAGAVPVATCQAFCERDSTTTAIWIGRHESVGLGCWCYGPDLSMFSGATYKYLSDSPQVVRLLAMGTSGLVYAKSSLDSCN